MSTEQPVTNVGETDANKQTTETNPDTAETKTAESMSGEAVGAGSSAAVATQREDAAAFAAQREDEDEPRPAGEDFGSLLDQFEQEQSSLQEGEVVRGTVVGITERGVVIDFGYKSEGIVNQNEFMEDGQITVKPGDEVD